MSYVRKVSAGGSWRRMLLTCSFLHISHHVASSSRCYRFLVSVTNSDLWYSDCHRHLVCFVTTASKKRGDPFPDDRRREGKEPRICKCYLFPRYPACALMICS